MEIYYGFNRKRIASDICNLLEIIYKKKVESDYYALYIDDVIERAAEKLS